MRSLAAKNSVSSCFRRSEVSMLLKKDIPVVIGETGATNKDNPKAREDWAYYMGMKAATYTKIK